MISGLLPQTKSRLKTIRGYGCYFMCLLAMVQDVMKRVFSLDEIENIFSVCKTNNFIFDNDIPITKPGWWRCYIASSNDVLSTAANITNNTIKAREIMRGKEITTTPKDGYTIVEYTTKYGSHFVVCSILGTNIIRVYNPDPKIAVGAVKTVRHWVITKG